jgi:hypothetical protein
MQIYAALHQKKRKNSQTFRQYGNRQELKQAFAEEPIKAMGMEEW